MDYDKFLLTQCEEIRAFEVQNPAVVLTLYISY